MDLRQRKGLASAARMRVEYQDGAGLVPSPSGSGTYRVVRKLEGDACPCEALPLRQPPCKQIPAARRTRERDHGGQSPAIDPEAVAKKPTDPQDGPVSNLASSIEKHRFPVLLDDRCQGRAEPARPGAGRRPPLVKDAIFALALKVDEGFCRRRTACDRKDAPGSGYRTKPVPGLKVGAFFENEAFPPVWQQLIVRSSLRLGTVETDFAPASSGFRRSRFVKW